MANRKSSQIVESETKEQQPSIEELVKMVSSLKKELDAIQKSPKKTEEKPAIKELAPNDYIKVMSLCPYEMCLSTAPRGRGKTFNFKKFGEIKKLFYSDLLDVINNHPNFFEAGYFYILNKDVITSNGYEETYAKILTKEQIEKILDSSPEAISLFENSNEKQRELIINIIIGKLRDNKQIDFNVVSAISRISNVDLIGKAKEASEATKFEN